MKEIYGIIEKLCEEDSDEKKMEKLKIGIKAF